MVPESSKPTMDEDELPEGWVTMDSLASFYEYVALILRAMAGW
jgi:hypothetical protein